MNSSLKFGTSGLRGLVEELTDGSSRLYARAFLRHLATTDTGGNERILLIGRDLRASSPAIAADCCHAARIEGWALLDCGALPTPALALLSLTRRLPAIMVTGSHIPDDRNGLKFYTAAGEITKADEAGILSAYADLVAAQPLADMPLRADEAGEVSVEAIDLYRHRYLEAFGPSYLDGLSIGIYQHSTVARDLLVEVVEALGANALPFARSTAFIPVDTEAYRLEDKALLAEFAAGHTVDAIISADGDADRPLLADADGNIVRGDVLGLLTALFLSLDTLVTPLTSSSAIERVIAPATVIRTRVGSPFVIAGMESAAQSGRAGIVGFEANGGLLLGSAVSIDGRRLEALPTRDALLPILCALGSIRTKSAPLSAIVRDLKSGSAAGNRLERVPAERSGPFLAHLADDAAFARDFFAELGQVTGLDVMDGVRATIADGRIVHFRASGNAPELRCYVEADNEAEAEALLAWGLAKAQEAMSA